MIQAHFEFLYPGTSRFEEIEKIINFIKQGKSCQIVGLPGVGRSNLLGLLSYNKNVRAKHLGENAKWFHFVPLNFSEIRKRSLADAWKFIFLNLSDSLRERKDTPLGRSGVNGEKFGQVVNNIFKETSSSNDELVLFSGLKKAMDFLCIEKELTVVFLFDNFEQYLPMLDSSFFTNLRVLRNRAKYRFSCVFSLGRPLEESIEPEIFSDFYEFLAGNIVNLSLADLPGLDFRISYLKKVTGKKLDRKTLEQIIALTDGHGKLTRLAAEAILSANVKSQMSNLKLTESLLEQKAVKTALFEIWQSLTPQEQKQAGKTVPIPLFEKFAATIQQSSNLTIAFDPSTNEIKKGDVVISDKLSALEFRLLKFLLENKDKICEKEEIINAVWKDTKTQEGVTDQALDQIVYRLRKKIEDDPNNPVHIQTIKGRGLRFSD